MTISAALKEIYASAPTTQRYVETLSFSHSLFPQTYHLTNDNKSWDFFLETGDLVTFQAMPFRLVLPTVDKGGNQDMSLTLANIGRDLVDPLEAAIAKPGEPIRCVYRVYLDIDASSPQNSPPLSLVITSVNVNRQAVSAVATRADVLNRAFPYNVYRFDNYPGLRR
ncbi:MAG: DUF1833 family protein [Pseudomonadales bacterium]